MLGSALCSRPGLPSFPLAGPCLQPSVFENTKGGVAFSCASIGGCARLPPFPHTRHEKWLIAPTLKSSVVCNETQERLWSCNVVGRSGNRSISFDKLVPTVETWAPISVPIELKGYATTNKRKKWPKMRTIVVQKQWGWLWYVQMGLCFRNTSRALREQHHSKWTHFLSPLCH